MPGYVTRLLRRTWAETRLVWTLHRWWLTLAPPLVALIALAYRHGWRALLNAPDVILNSVYSALIVFIGTLLINLVRSCKLLDDDRGKALDDANATIGTMSAELTALKTPKRSAHEEHRYQDAKTHLEALPDDAKEVLRQILLHERLVGGRIDKINNVRHDRVMQILNGDSLKPLVRREDVNDPGLGPRASWVIVPGYKTALNELLYPINS